MTSFKPVLRSLPTEDPILVLFVSARDEDHTASPALVSSVNCMVHHATTCEVAAVMLRQYSYPVVVTDRTMPDGTWLDLQHGRASRSKPPQVIVLAAAGDYTFWANALLLGAFDVLHRPLTGAHLSAAIVVGYRRWNRSAEVINARAENILARAQHVIPITQFRRKNRLVLAQTVGSLPRKVIWRGQTKVAVPRSPLATA
jgi:DNA-binding response OmpR family regulator